MLTFQLTLPSELPFSPLNSTEPSSFKDAEPCLSISLAWHISIFFKRRTTTRCEDVTFPFAKVSRLNSVVLEIDKGMTPSATSRCLPFNRTSSAWDVL